METHLENTPPYFFTRGHSRLAVQACRKAAGFAFERTLLWTILGTIAAYILSKDWVTALIIAVIISGACGYTWLTEAKRFRGNKDQILNATAQRLRRKLLSKEDIQAMKNHTLSGFNEAELMYDIQDPTIMRLYAISKDREVLAEITECREGDLGIWKTYIKPVGASDNVWIEAQSNQSWCSVVPLGHLFREFQKRESLVAV